MGKNNYPNIEKKLSINDACTITVERYTQTSTYITKQGILNLRSKKPYTCQTRYFQIIWNLLVYLDREMIKKHKKWRKAEREYKNMVEMKAY